MSDETRRIDVHVNNPKIYISSHWKRCSLWGENFQCMLKKILFGRNRQNISKLGRVIPDLLVIFNLIVCIIQPNLMG